MPNSDQPNLPQQNDEAAAAECLRILDDTICAYERKIQEHTLLIDRHKRAKKQPEPGPKTDIVIRRAA